MTERLRVLFLCTGNSCRSQLAEAILHHLGGDRFDALSAGSHPAGFVHPLAIECMRLMHVPLSEPRSKSWDEFADQPVDVVITVCDVAAGEACPVWPGDPLVAHWPLPDPAHHFGTDEERIAFAMRVAERLRTKIEGLLAIDFSSGRRAIAGRLAFLGEI